MSQGELRPGRVLVSEKTENLDVLNISYETGPTFLPDLPSVWVDEAHCQIMERAGIPYMDAVKVLTYHLSFVLKRHCEEFIGLQETRFLLDKMEGHHQELVKELQRVMPLQKINEILQRLAQEQISIRNLRSIFQALIEWGQKEKDPILLTEYARSSLKRYISYRYSSGQNMLAVYLLDPSVEETIRSAIRQTSSGSYLALDPQVAKELVDRIKNEVGDFRQHSQKPVLLTSMDIRRYVRRLIEMELYELSVLSYQELTPEISVQPIGRIELD